MCHSIKLNRACGLSRVGVYPHTASSIIDAIPPDIVAALPARLLASLIDTIWARQIATKARHERDLIDEGYIWDSTRGRMLDLVVVIAQDAA